MYSRKRDHTTSTDSKKYRRCSFIAYIHVYQYLSSPHYSLIQRANSHKIKMPASRSVRRDTAHHGQDHDRGVVAASSRIVVG